jgi:hypothetical protein
VNCMLNNLIILCWITRRFCKLFITVFFLSMWQIYLREFHYCFGIMATSGSASGLGAGGGVGFSIGMELGEENFPRGLKMRH